MNTKKFKTNINCSGCLSKVSPFLNEEKNIKEWNVNLEDEDRVLTVHSSDLTPDQIKKTVKKAGFSAEEL